MDFEGLVLYGNEFMGYIKVSQATSGLSDQEIGKIKGALRKSERITTVRVEQFLNESTSEDGTLDKQKFICLVSQEIICSNWTQYKDFLKTANLNKTRGVEIEDIGKHAKISNLDQGYFIYKIDDWTGEHEQLNQILNDVVKYYNEFKNIELKDDTAPSAFIPMEILNSSQIKLFSRRLIGLETIPVIVCGVEFTSQTATKVLIYFDEETKNALLLIHGRALFGDKDWEGKIAGISREGNAEFISKILGKYKTFRPAKGRGYDVLHLILTEIYK